MHLKDLVCLNLKEKFKNIDKMEQLIMFLLEQVL